MLDESTEENIAMAEQLTAANARIVSLEAQLREAKENYRASYDDLRQNVDAVAADNARLRAALEQVEKWTRFYMPLAEGSSWEETLREVHQFAQAALAGEGEER